MTEAARSLIRTNPAAALRKQGITLLKPPATKGNVVKTYRP